MTSVFSNNLHSTDIIYNHFTGMSRSIRTVSNDRTKKEKKTVARERCKKLLTALQERSKKFVKECKEFCDASNNFVTYCNGYKGRADHMSESILKIFASYITIYVYFWKQYIYLNDGICSFQYQLDESLDKIITVRDSTLHEATTIITMFINVGGQNNLTDTSLEGIYNFLASNNLNSMSDNDFLATLETTVKDPLQEAGQAITKSVKKVTDNLIKMRVTKKHHDLVPKYSNSTINFEYHYEENAQKRTIILRKGGKHISSFSDNLERLRDFNDSVLTNQQSMHSSRANTVSPACK